LATVVAAPFTIEVESSTGQRQKQRVTSKASTLF
jgi:hypothetical protein